MNPLRRRLTFYLSAIALGVLIALGLSITSSAQGAVTRSDCRAVVRATVGGSHVKRSVARGCLRVAVQQETDAAYNACARRGGQAGAACALRIAFGPWGEQAVGVARCESTLTYTKTNGEHWGLLQVSYDWRKDIPGFAWNPRAQAEHGRKVFDAVGHDWSPTWDCSGSAG